MKRFIVVAISLSALFSCVIPQAPLSTDSKIVFLHHSTGGVIWGGGVADWFAQSNVAHETAYEITERAFPEDTPPAGEPGPAYGWNNYPFDYWNIWVNHAGNAPYVYEPTLEMLTTQYEVIVFKHCFPVSEIQADTGDPHVNSDIKSVENYKLQYDALKAKMRSFPNTRFIVWTGAALVEAATDQAQAQRAQTFFNWVKTSWDEKGDNIYVWDFYGLETEGNLYMRNEHATPPDPSNPDQTIRDSHPNGAFAAEVAPYFGQRVVDVIEGRGDTASITGR